MVKRTVDVFLRFDETDDMIDTSVFNFVPVFRVICHARNVPINFDKIYRVYGISLFAIFPTVFHFTRSSLFCSERCSSPASAAGLLSERETKVSNLHTTRHKIISICI
jgi:hypothetical protein